MKNTKLDLSAKEQSTAESGDLHRRFNGLRRAGYLHLLVTILALFTSTAFGAPGDLDSTFGRGGAVTTDFKGSNDIANAAALQADGKIVTAGIRFVGISAATGDFLVARYNTNGTIDKAFGQGGS